jgi:hypothetical protein
VFEAMLENAVRICEAKFGNLFLYRDDTFRIVAMQNPPVYARFLRRNGSLKILTYWSTVRSAQSHRQRQARIGYRIPCELLREILCRYTAAA